MIPNKFDKRALGYAVKYNGIVVPQTFVLGLDSHQRTVARQLFTLWGIMKGITFESAEAEGKAILVKLKEVIDDQSDKNISFLSAFAGTDESFNLTFEGDGESDGKE